MASVFRAYDDEDRLLYVGLRRQHDAPWTQGAVRWEEKQYPTKTQAMLVIVEAIRYELPLYNDKGSVPTSSLTGSTATGAGSDLYVLVQLVLGEDPVRWIMEQREDGGAQKKTWDEIAFDLGSIMKRPISRETVRQWVAQRTG